MDVQALLSGGDAAAADAFVRGLARGLVGGSDADDVAQETWLAALRRPLEGAAKAPAYLAAVVRNAARKLARGRRRSDAREARAARPEATEALTRFVEQQELHRRLVDAVLALEAPYAEAVVLRYFEDLPPRDMARRLGVPLATVKARLRRALARLRERFDRDPGGRAAWVSALLPIAGLAEAGASTAAASMAVPLLGAAMTAKLKTLVAALVCVVCAGMWWNLSSPKAPAPVRTPLPASAEAEPFASRTDRPSEPGAAATVAREAFADADRPTTRASASLGALDVEVRWADGSPAAGVVVDAALDVRALGSRREATGSDGRRRFDGLEPGRWVVRADRGALRDATVQGGTATTVRFDLASGLRVDGVAVDRDGRGIADAEIHLVGTLPWTAAPPSARTRADGTFVLRDVEQFVRVVARRDGYAPSWAAHLSADLERDGVVPVRLTLERGGALRGSVVGPDGVPVAATVQLGTDGTLRRTTPDGGTESAPPPRLLRTDATGSFAAHDLAPGSVPVSVRGTGFGAWSGSAEIAADAVARLEIRLNAPGEIAGFVRDARGRPIARASVFAGGSALTVEFAQTAADGSFRLTNVGAGTVRLRAVEPSGRNVEAEVPVEPGKTSARDLVFEARDAIEGRLVDEKGAPLAAWNLALRGVGIPADTTTLDGYVGGTWTDKEGRFAIKGLRAASFELFAYGPREAPQFARRFAAGVAPGDAPREYAVPGAASTASLVGRVVDAAGRPVSAATVTVVPADFGVPVAGSLQHATTDDEGVFKFGPFPAGTLRGAVEHARYATLRLRPFEVGSGETRDLGDLRLDAPGTLVVTLARHEALRNDARRAGVTILSERGDDLGFAPFVEDRALERLPAGTYRLLPTLIGDGAAFYAPMTTVVVRPDEEARATVSVEPAPNIRLLFAPPSGASAGDSLDLSIKSADGAVVWDLRVPAHGRTEFAVSPGLRPGRYAIAARTPTGLSFEGVVEIPEGAADDREPRRCDLR
jgi:RNA polymerase sigma-70 factor (ECF subfamily)